MKKVIMALPIVLILIVMILSLTCPISYSYHTSYVKISGVGTIKNDRSGEYSYYLKDDLGISSGGAIAIVVVFCALAIAGIVFLYKSKDLRVYSYYGMIIATIACALVPSIMAIICSAMKRGWGKRIYVGRRRGKFFKQSSRIGSCRSSNYYSDDFGNDCVRRSTCKNTKRNELIQKTNRKGESGSYGR